MNENEEKIYDLISSKSFAQLTEAEKAMVLDSLGSAELYEKMREANLAAEEALSDDLTPPAELKSAVMAAFDEKNEKRGIVWWKYAAAVAVLIVGAFVFWPTGNVDREPIAENVIRKDSTEKKKERLEDRKADEATLEKEEKQEETKPQIERPKEPTITSIELSEIADEEIIEDSFDDEAEETLEEVEMDFADESAEEFSAPEEEVPNVPTITYDGDSKSRTDDQPNATAIPQSRASDSSTVRLEAYVASTTKGGDELSATTSFSSEMAKKSVSYEGITVESIGGVDKKAYVAY